MRDMKLADFDWIESLCNWFAPPLVIGASQSVTQVLDALNAHPLVQDNFYCFVTAKDANEVDPPVYFETCLDLVRDCRIDPTLVLSGNCVLVTEHFNSFLMFMLAHHISLRLEKGSHLAEEVNGIVFSQPKTACSGLINPLGKEFIAGYTAYIGNNVICIPDWGAAFRHQIAREEFVKSNQVAVGKSWP